MESWSAATSGGEYRNYSVQAALHNSLLEARNPAETLPSKIRVRTEELTPFSWKSTMGSLMKTTRSGPQKTVQLKNQTPFHTFIAWSLKCTIQWSYAPILQGAEHFSPDPSKAFKLMLIFKLVSKLIEVNRTMHAFKCYAGSGAGASVWVSTLQYRGLCLSFSGLCWSDLLNLKSGSRLLKMWCSEDWPYTQRKIIGEMFLACRLEIA